MGGPSSKGLNTLAQSSVQICNRGLSKYLGLPRINNLDEATPVAELCKLHYEDSLRVLTEHHWWSFAAGRNVMAELPNDRPQEWNYKYQKPADALAIRWVNDPVVAANLLEVGEEPDSDRLLFGQHIYSNVFGAACEFSKLIDDATKFPQYFADALSAEIAASVAMSLTEDMNRARNAFSEAERLLEEAVVLDESDHRHRTYRSTPDYLKVRGL